MCEIDETYDCLDMPPVAGGFRGYLTDGIAGYLGIKFVMNEARGKAMEEYPTAFCALVKAVAEEAKKLREEGVPPFDGSYGEDRMPDREGDGKCKVTITIRDGRYTRTWQRTTSVEKAKEIVKKARR